MRKQYTYICKRCAVDCEVGLHGSDENGAMYFNRATATPCSQFRLNRELRKIKFRDLKIDPTFSSTGEKLMDAFKCPLCSLSSFKRFRYVRELDDSIIVSCTDKHLCCDEYIGKRLFICPDHKVAGKLLRKLRAMPNLKHTGMSGHSQSGSSYRVTRHYRVGSGYDYRLCVYGKNYRVILSTIYDNPYYYGLDEYGKPL